MTMSRARKDRAMRTQLVVAEWFGVNGFPHAESTGSGRSGVDVKGMVGMAPEVKARADWSPLAWIRQAVRNSKGALPFVVARMNGQGEATVADWPVIMRLEDFTALIRAAGYGDPLEHVIEGTPEEVIPDTAA